MAENLQRIDGPNLCLRLVTHEDADYILSLRSDPQYNRYLSETTGDIEDQKAWISTYKAREAAGLEYYYVIERLDGLRCGVVRLYEITKETFTWGSWILDGNKPPKAALESAVLSFGIGFEKLGIEIANIDSRIENQHAIAFYRRLGVTQLRQDECDIFFEYSRTQYRRDLRKYFSIINNANNGILL